MSKWIDYDAIDYKHYQLHDKSEEFLNGVVYMAERIEEAPSIDIVRCKECRYKDMELCAMYKLVAAGVRRYDDFCSYGERKDEPKTQTKTQNSNLTFEKDECAKEYEELGLKELKELIEADRKTEPTISKMEQVDKDINVRGKWETPPKFEHKGEITTCVSVPACLLEIEDEPQTDGYMTAEQTEDYRKMLDKAERKVYGNIEDEPHIVGKHADVIIIDEPWYKEEPKDEPQTDCPWK